MPLNNRRKPIDFIDPRMENADTAMWVMKLRQNLNLTQPGFAAVSGINLQTIINWEAGKTRPSSKTCRRALSQLAKPLGMPELPDGSWAGHASVMNIPSNLDEEFAKYFAQK